MDMSAQGCPTDHHSDGARQSHVERPRMSAETRAKLSAALTRHYADNPAARERQRQQRLAEPPRGAEYRARLSEAIKTKCQDPDYRAKLKERALEVGSRPEIKAARAAATKALMQRPEERERRVVKIRAALADPKVRTKLGWLNPDQRKQIADTIESQPERTYLEIGLDWLVSESVVKAIAKEFDVQRRPSPKRIYLAS